MAVSVVFCIIAGVICRLALFQTDLPIWLETKNEVVTPITAWERVEEGLALKKSMVSPYTGDVFHEVQPINSLIHLILFLKELSDFRTFLVLLKTIFTYSRLKSTPKMLHLDVKKYSVNVEDVLLKSKDLRSLPLIVVAVHVFNPYSISICLAKSTAVLSNLSIFIFIIRNIYKLDNLLLTTLFIAVSTYQSFYPFIFCLPVASYFYHVSFHSAAIIKHYIPSFGLFLFWFMLLLGISYSIEGSWTFLYSTYGFILNVPDLSPNVGVFWYFFTEMFEHFRVFFICIFQINSVIYSIPLAVKLKRSPVFFLYMMIFITSIFKSYPSYGDIGLCLSLLPLWKHTFSYMRNLFVVTCMYIVCTVFAPILYHLWIYAGSANANFYFAITLAFSAAQIFLVTDLLFAFLRREYDLYHGTNHKLENGKTTQVVLE
ncbi:hypothetical protein LOTGIDRAFT_108975 [Lottia gigantea]|uniref:Phosphatidylinositol glycan anchor biosynthesis class U protein n=1 Tax=Lottia gigantea TaxID=225164 RepID=V4B2N5_LOTGI|nr:hypothetical protein LOTGIDRAFT_108975 [Lottia gigantea]ESO82759.1 hypothetical protein LOTGIDRAFT_108975 [Lottia gigantea]